MMAFLVVGLKQFGVYSDAEEAEEAVVAAAIAAANGTYAESNFMHRLDWYMLPFFAYIAPPFAGIDQFDGGSSIFMLIYLFITTRVLQSMLTSIFATAIGPVFRNSEIEYMFENHLALFEYRHVRTLLPPPLNLPWVIVSLLSSCCCKKTQDIEPKAKTETQKRHSAFGTLSPSLMREKTKRQPKDKVSVALFVDKYRKAQAAKAQASLDKRVVGLHDKFKTLSKETSEMRSEINAKFSRLEAALGAVLPPAAPAAAGGPFGLELGSERVSSKNKWLSA